MIDNRQNRSSSDCGCQGINCRGLMKKLKVIDFAITDTVLYLDAYPHCQKALEHYRQLTAERAMLVDAINEKCGPMTHRDNKSCSEWTWTNGPWPWELDAN